MIYQLKRIIRSLCLPVQILPQQQELDPTNIFPWEQEQEYWTELDDAEAEDDYNLYGSGQGGSSYDSYEDEDTGSRNEEDAF